MNSWQFMKEMPRVRPEPMEKPDKRLKIVDIVWE